MASQGRRPRFLSLCDQIKTDDMGGACSTREKYVNCMQKVSRKPEGKGPLGRPRHRREGNITMDRREIGREDVDWIYLA